MNRMRNPQVNHCLFPARPPARPPARLRYAQGRDAVQQLGKMMRSCGLEGPVLIIADQAGTDAAVHLCSFPRVLQSACRAQGLQWQWGACSGRLVASGRLFSWGAV